MENKIDKSEIKNRLLQILEYIDYVCKKNNIEYFLSYGTLLGAVRHQGFIPWDDDIDLNMKRDQYNLFLEAFSKEKQNRFKLIFHENTPNYLWGFAKIIDIETIVAEHEVKVPFEYGLFVDIFPLDEASYDTQEDIENDNAKLLSFYRKYMINYQKYFIINKKYASLCNYILLKEKGKTKYITIDTSEIAKEQNRYLENFPKEKNLKVLRDGVSNPPESYRHFKKEWFDKTIYTKFEHLTLPIPKGYDALLTILYGDYMTPPPEKDRNKGHFSKVALR